VERKPNAPANPNDPTKSYNIAYEWQSAPVSVFPASLEESINDRWTLTATYRRSSQTHDKTGLALQSAYFIAGASGGHNAYGASMDPNKIDLLGTAQFSATVGNTVSGIATLRDWPLPVSYRGEKKVSDDDTVVINLYKDKH